MDPLSKGQSLKAIEYKSCCQTRTILIDHFKFCDRWRAKSLMMTRRRRKTRLLISWLLSSLRLRLSKKSELWKSVALQLLDLFSLSILSFLLLYILLFGLDTVRLKLSVHQTFCVTGLYTVQSKQWSLSCLRLLLSIFPALCHSVFRWLYLKLRVNSRIFVMGACLTKAMLW